MFARILPKVGCDSSVCGYSTLIYFGMSEPTHLTSRFRCRRWSVKDITRRRRASGVGALYVSPLGPRVAARRRTVGDFAILALHRLKVEFSCKPPNL